MASSNPLADSQILLPAAATAIAACAALRVMLKGLLSGETKSSGDQKSILKSMAFKLYDANLGSKSRTSLLVGKAPGRVNLIGEHVDYNMGFVMPIAIQNSTVVAGTKDDNDSFTLVLPDFKNPSAPAKVLRWTRKEFFTNSRPVEWHNYVRGVAALMQESGYDVPGFKAVIVGNVPLGGGLSSSASLEVATATFLENLCGKTMPKVEKARLCQKVEHTWCDVPCGIMDQFASVFGKDRSAMLIDCKTNTHTLVPMNDPSVSILIVNSNVKHALVDGAYKKRKAACDAAAHKLNVGSLREVSPEALEGSWKAAGLTDLELKRARHVVSEIARTTKAAESLRKNDYKSMGKLMHESHVSLRDLYNVSCEELDFLVETAEKCPGVYGARMTGAGFGGSCVVLVKSDSVDEVRKIIKGSYKSEFGKDASFLASPPSEGATASIWT